MEDEDELPIILESLKPLPKFAPNDLTRYFSSVAGYYQSKLDKTADPVLYKKFILSTIIQLYSLTWSASKVYLTEKSQPTRLVYERLTPSKQCDSIIGISSLDSECWLCGYSMRDFPYKTTIPEWTGPSSKGKSPNKPECEHVLALCAGLLFYGIPPTSEDATRDAEFYKLNYGWSHTRCNLLKSSYLFTDIFVKGNSVLLDVPVYNIDYVNRYLEALYYTLFISPGTKQYPILSRKIETPGKAEWIAKRELAIREKIQSLILNIWTLKTRDTKSIFDELNFDNHQISRCTSGIFQKYQESLIQSQNIQVSKGITLDKLLLEQKQKLFKPIIGETTPKLCALPNAEGIIVELVGDETITRDIARDIISVCRPTGGTRKRKHSRKTRRHKWRK